MDVTDEYNRKEHSTHKLKGVEQHQVSIVRVWSGLVA
jgi:hypothetical protein